MGPATAGHPAPHGPRAARPGPARPPRPRKTLSDPVKGVEHAEEHDTVRSDSTPVSAVHHLLAASAALQRLVLSPVPKEEKRTAASRKSAEAGWAQRKRLLGTGPASGMYSRVPPS